MTTRRRKPRRREQTQQGDGEGDVMEAAMSSGLCRPSLLRKAYQWEGPAVYCSEVLLPPLVKLGDQSLRVEEEGGRRRGY